MSVRRRAHRLAFRGIAATLFAAGVLVVACGIDELGTKPSTPPDVDSAVPLDAKQPPRDDGAIIPKDAGAPDAPIEPCPAGRGPTMIAIGDGGDGGFCIDSTEVTNAQYDAFLAATDGGEVDAGGLPIECTTIAMFATFQRRDAVGNPITAAAPPNNPVTFVEWCAAVGYCGWAGKRLCARRPMLGAPGDAGREEWLRACSADFTRRYPYGAALVPSACNQGNASGGAVEEAGARAGCVGGFPGLFDMSGNASEWIDYCDAVGNCTLAGGYYGTPDGGATCRAAEVASLTTRSDSLGFRCCASPR